MGVDSWTRKVRCCGLPLRDLEKHLACFGILQYNGCVFQI